MIPVSEPLLAGAEAKYVADCIQTGWISSEGRYLAAFEQAWAKYCGAEFGVGVSNGTTALQIAVVALSSTISPKQWQSASRACPIATVSIVAPLLRSIRYSTSLGTVGPQRSPQPTRVVERISPISPLATKSFRNRSGGAARA